MIANCCGLAHGKGALSSLLSCSLSCLFPMLPKVELCGRAFKKDGKVGVPYLPYLYSKGAHEPRYSHYRIDGFVAKGGCPLSPPYLYLRP